MKKITAVEWLIEADDELNKRCLQGTLSWFEYSDEKKKLENEAKQMEKEQIMDAYWEGGQDVPVDAKLCEIYYKETYKNTNE